MTTQKGAAPAPEHSHTEPPFGRIRRKWWNAGFEEGVAQRDRLRDALSETVKLFQVLDAQLTEHGHPDIYITAGTWADVFRPALKRAERAALTDDPEPLPRTLTEKSDGWCPTCGQRATNTLTAEPGQQVTSKWEAREGAEAELLALRSAAVALLTALDGAADDLTRGLTREEADSIRGCVDELRGLSGQAASLYDEIKDAPDFEERTARARSQIESGDTVPLHDLYRGPRADAARASRSVVSDE